MKSMSDHQERRVIYINAPSNPYVDARYHNHLTELERIAALGDINRYHQTVLAQLEQYRRLGLMDVASLPACRLAVRNLAMRAMTTYAALFREVVEGLAKSGLTNYSSMLMAGASRLTNGLIALEVSYPAVGEPCEMGDALCFKSRKEDLGCYIGYIQELQEKTK